MTLFGLRTLMLRAVISVPPLIVSPVTKLAPVNVTPVIVP